MMALMFICLIPLWLLCAEQAAAAELISHHSWFHAARRRLASLFLPDRSHSPDFTHFTFSPLA